MNKFNLFNTFEPNKQKFIIEQNQFLSQELEAFGHCDYFGIEDPKNPNFLLVFKNNNNKESSCDLDKASNILLDILYADFLNYFNNFNLIEPNPDNLVMVCVPRAKAENELLYSQKNLEKRLVSLPQVIY